MHASPILKDEVTDVAVKVRGSDPKGPWANEDAVARIKVLWVDHSATQIAGVLWDEFRLQVTRNAVVGKLFRMGLTINDKTELHPLTRNEPSQSRPRAHRAPRSPIPLRTFQFRQPNLSKEEIVLRCVEIEPRYLSLLDLQHGDCRYIYGDGPFTYCGHPKLTDSSYCSSHHSLTHTASRTISEADHERRRRHFIGLLKKNNRVIGVPA